MPRYQCPECGAIVKSDMPIASGRKLRCKKCETVYSAVAMPEAEAPGKPAKPPKPSKPEAAKPEPVAPAAPKNPFDDDEDEGPVTYEVIREKEGDQAEAVHYGSLRDKYEKSMRGPAVALAIDPANFLTGGGVVVCVLAVIGFIASVFPLVFTENTPSGAETRVAIFRMVGMALMFCWGALVCNGAAKLQNLESYTWAWVAAVMGIVPFFFGVYAIVVLCDEVVRKGFIETAKMPDFRKPKARG